MAIKRRERPAIDSAAIDSFGDAADVPAEQPAPTVSAPAATAGETPAPAPVRAAARPRPTKPAAASDAAQAWPADLSKTFLLRFPDPSIPLEIEELQDLVARNKHQTILLALRRGIDALRREAEELGDRAELIK